MLVARFEDSLLACEDQIGALEDSLHAAQTQVQADRDELITTQQVLRILEHENARLTAEVEALRAEAAAAAPCLEVAELEPLCQQVSELSFSSNRRLEQMLRQQNYG
jgi:hypothetical protein